MLDIKGKVVGVVVSGIKGARVNFAIPVTHVARFVEKPDIVFIPPAVDWSKANKSVRFEARLASVLPSSVAYDVDLILKNGATESTHRMKLSEDKNYLAEVALIPVPEGTAELHVTASFPEGSVSGMVADATFKLGTATRKLSEMRSLYPGDRFRGIQLDDKEVSGEASGLDAIPFRLGADRVTLNLHHAREVRIEPKATSAPFFTCTVVVRNGDKEISRQRAYLIDEKSLARTFLVDMEDFNVKAGPWPMGKGNLGNPDRSPIIVNGVRSPHGIGMHANGSASFRLGRNPYLFRATVGVNDNKETWQPGDIFFEVLADGKSLWKSKAIKKGASDECEVELSGKEVLELRTNVQGESNGAHAVWVEPVVIQGAAADKTGGPKPAGPYLIKLPIPDRNIPVDLSVWKGSFLVTKVAYEPDERKVVFTLKTERAFQFTDDGFVAPLRLFDEEGVNLASEKETNLKFEGDITKLKVGDTTRMYLALPDEEILKKVKRGQAIIKGFFADKKK